MGKYCWGSTSADLDTAQVYTHTYIPTAPGTSKNIESSASGIVEVESHDDGWFQLETPPPTLKVFTFKELKAATRKFTYVLGGGDSVTVYKGWLEEKTLAPSKVGSGISVAIKKLKNQSGISFEMWQSEEKNSLASFSHPSLIKLVGYCWNDKDQLLVYEFMQKGSLDNHLFRRKPAIGSLSWETRLKIAIGAARGLAYLHSSNNVYACVKASKILLDRNYNAKLSGPCGTKKAITTNMPYKSKNHAQIFNTNNLGYESPEFQGTGYMSVKSDVYGFGVVLLEMMTGLRGFDAAKLIFPLSVHNKTKLKRIMDVQIEGQYSSEAATQTAQLILKCLQPELTARPSMKDVEEALELILNH